LFRVRPATGKSSLLLASVLASYLISFRGSSLVGAAISIYILLI
jgi:hypothetical protein